MRRVGEDIQGLRAETDKRAGITSVKVAGGAGALPAVIAREDARSRERYLEFFAVTIRNAHTRRAYLTATSQFFAWLEGRGLGLSEVTPMLVAGYIESHPGEALTVRQHLAALRRLFDWLVTGGILNTSPVTSVRGPRLTRRVGKTPIMTAAGAAGVIGATESPTLAGLRDRALLLVMLLSFARIGALLAVSRSGYRKGQDRSIPLHKEAALALDSWIAAAGPADGDSPLFPAIDPVADRPTTRVLGARAALRRVKRAAVRAGAPASICNHSFRATGITLFRAAGGSIERAQMIAGHATTETTRLYDRSEERLNADELEIRLVFDPPAQPTAGPLP